MPRPTGSAVLPPDRAGSPGSLIVSFAGAFLRDIGGWIAVADLIRCLSEVGVAEPSVRQALVRLKYRGFLTADRRGGDAGYRLTPAGLHDLATGDRRIFRPPAATEQDGWVLAIFSVPESERHLRHRLRTELSWLGFGTVGPGVWIAPRPLAEPARDLLVTAELDGYVTWFAAHRLAAPGPSATDVAGWWDLDGLRGQYDEFLRAHRGMDTGQGVSDSRAFVDYLRIIDQWRLFPRIDPGLPPALLPADWPAGEAWDLFRTVRERCAGPALRHVRRMVDADPGVPEVPAAEGAAEPVPR
jgi:phenylacetic acid degradation operon negative regulatory protein